MSIPQILPNSVASSPSDLNQLSKTTQPAENAQTNVNAQKTIEAAKTDTVTISKQALKMVSDGDNAAQELKESGAEKASEKLLGKK